MNRQQYFECPLCGNEFKRLWQMYQCINTDSEATGRNKNGCVFHSDMVENDKILYPFYEVNPTLAETFFYLFVVNEVRNNSKVHFLRKSRKCLEKYIADVEKKGIITISCPESFESDDVSGPWHYNWHPHYECKQIVGEMSFFLGSAVKYLWRHRHFWRHRHSRHGLKDLRKAMQNIEFEERQK